MSKHTSNSRKKKKKKKKCFVHIDEKNINAFVYPDYRAKESWNFCLLFTIMSFARRVLVSDASTAEFEFGFLATKLNVYAGSFLAFSYISSALGERDRDKDTKREK